MYQNSRVYPLEGDPDLLHVCWRLAAGFGDHGSIVHIVSEEGYRTLCGVPLYEGDVRMPKAWWDYAVWSRKDDGWGVEFVGCVRCKHSRRLLSIQEDGPPHGERLCSTAQMTGQDNVERQS